MAKKFNVTGTCFPEDHYMADVSKKMDATYKMIEEGEYFIINRPRQYGKTTTLYTMMDRLIAAKYAVFNISFEGIGDTIFNDEPMFSKGFLRLLASFAHESVPELKTWLTEAALQPNNLEDLSKIITELCSKTTKKVIVLIDEVDKSSNNQLFVSFLAMLRNKYLERKRNPTFHSVVLAGVHDVKNLKLKIRPDEAAKYNSPWNIATEFTVDMTLSPDEIKPMLEDYMQEKSIKMDTQLIADRLYYLTSGYPYLVSHLCKIVAEEIMPTKMAHSDTIGTVMEWTEADVNKAFQLILRKRSNANFDTIIKNLKDYPLLYQLVYSLIIDGLSTPYDDSNSTINLGVLHGILGQSKDGSLIIHNRIYRELIANMMISEWRTNTAIQSGRNTDVFSYISQYHLPNKGLDMQKVLENFQIFMRKEYSGKDKEFLERDGRLIFLAFLRPILNGAGYDFKEPQVSDEKRLDVIMTYHQHLYVAELKIWHGAEAHKKGLAQLAAYLDTLSLDTGFLLIFDTNKKKKWEKGWTDSEGKRIFWIRV
jgi:AAA-like domain